MVRNLKSTKISPCLYIASYQIPNYGTMEDHSEEPSQYSYLSLYLGPLCLPSTLTGQAIFNVWLSCLVSV